MAHSAARDDASLIEAVQHDAARKALTAIASRLSQVAAAGGNARQLRGAGALLMEAVPDLELAIAQGAPTFSGIGDTLPAELVTRVVDTARLLSAVEEPPVAAVLRRGMRNPVRLAESVRDAMQAVLGTAQQAVTTVLADAGITIAVASTAADPLPAAAWRDRELAFAVQLQRWPETLEALRAWTTQAREAAGVRCRIVFVAIEDGEVLSCRAFT